MTIDEIERRLRQPAPDEPSVLPALLLPIHVGAAPLSERRVDLRVGRRRWSTPLAVLGTALLLVGALVGALLTGALRLEQLRDALPIPGLYTGHGITVDYPDSWTRLTPHDPTDSSGAWVALIVGNRDVDGCATDSPGVAEHSPAPQPEPSADGVTYLGDQQGVIYHLEDRIYNCLLGQPLEPGEVRVVVSRDRPQAIGVGPIGDFEGTWLAPNPEVGGPVLVSAETGFTETIGEMPAQRILRDRSVVAGAEELLTWVVAIPRSAESLWWVQAVMRGPDLTALEAEVDAVARSLTFDDIPAPLDEAQRDVALGMAVDSVDRAMRQYPGRRFLECIPRVPGAVEATVDDGPRGRLTEPLAVTCTTTASGSDLRVWQADIEVAWAASDDHPAGRWARRILFDADGSVQLETDLVPGTGEPLAFPDDPGTIVPEGVASFAPGELVRSVGAGAGTAFYDVDTTRLPPEPHLYLEPGALAVILSGPERYDGRDFYLADTGEEVGWVGVEAQGAGLLVPAEPSCPSSLDATELTYLSPLERRRCAAGEIELGPVQAALLEHDPSWDQIDAEPAWLAAQPIWALYADGTDGLDPGLPVVLAPNLEGLPADDWITVTGHFDDPASPTCRVVHPEDWGVESPSPDAQTRRCQERFVVTSVKPTEAP